jgi:uncharacterized protein with HEPN domain
MANHEALLSNIIRLQHMLDAAREAIMFARGLSLEQIASDRMRLLALSWKLIFG